MAPSSRNRATQQPRPQIPVFRVTKLSRLNERPIASHLKQKINAIENAISENAPLPTLTVAPSLQLAEATISKASKKRRRDSNSQIPDVDNTGHENVIKRVKKAVPAASLRKQQEKLPELLQELSQLHKHFMHALSVHIAHSKGGIRDVVDLAALLPTMTRLWRKRAVQVHDIQRILAPWEIQEISLDQSAITADSEISHSKGPFRIEQVGTGMNATTTLEYTWTTLTGETFIETELQRKYEEVIQRLYASYINRQHQHQHREKDADEPFIWRTINDIPKLRCEVSALTQQRREKVTSIKSHILCKTPTSLPNHQDQQQQQPPQQPDLSNLSIHEPNSPPQKKQQDDSTNSSVKSRTMNLFDRVRAKQLLNASAAPLTPAQLLRQRALQRIPDLVDVLRLKQARKLIGQQQQRQTIMAKVSFSFEALVQEIKDSLRNEVAGEEIREGITILGLEMPDGWCRVYEMGSVKCVTLQGEAMARKEVERWCKGVAMIVR